MPSIAHIDIQQLKKNHAYIQKHWLNQNQSMLPVLKANAYGHDVTIVAKALDPLQPVAFALANLQEIMQILPLKLKTPFFNFADLLDDKDFFETLSVEDKTCFFNKSIVSVHSVDSIHYLAQKHAALPTITKPRIHLKIDTGMHRRGFQKNVWQDVYNAILKHKLTESIEGIYTHLSDSNNINSEHSRDQLILFEQACHYFTDKLGKNLIKHAASSSPAQNLNTQTQYDWIRPGIALYGYPYAQDNNIKPILTWTASIVTIKKLKKGDHVGYMQTFTAKHDMTLATIAVGYADGFSTLYQKHKVYYKDKACDILGAISMDMLCIDISPIQNACIGDWVTLLSNKNNNDLNHLVNISGKKKYEIFTSIGKRVIRKACHVTA